MVVKLGQCRQTVATIGRRLRRPRFTLAGLMAAVTILAVMLGLNAPRKRIQAEVARARAEYNTAMANLGQSAPLVQAVGKSSHRLCLAELKLANLDRTSQDAREAWVNHLARMKQLQQEVDSWPFPWNEVMAKAAVESQQMASAFHHSAEVELAEHDRQQTQAAQGP
jgi:hypothetical protein